ncbi:MAG: hypothetical protein OEU32_08895 [Acidimicrobiia bacterium]|nr:hypothetical protein [Acidimicrobiia bacterium]
MDLVDAVELGRAVPREDTREPRAEPGADDNEAISFARLGVEIEQGADVLDAVGHGNHIGSAEDRLVREPGLAPPS